jgi:hypothetical protein
LDHSKQTVPAIINITASAADISPVPDKGLRDAGAMVTARNDISGKTYDPSSELVVDEMNGSLPELRRRGVPATISKT